MNYLLIFLLFIFPTIIHGQNKDSLRRELAKHYHLNDSALNVWRADSNGCKNLRGQYAYLLREDSLLIGMPVKIILLLFGNPNGKNLSDKNDDVYVYLCGTACDANYKIIPNKDGYMASIWLYFIINKGQLTDIEISVP